MSDESKIRDAADAIKAVLEAVPVYQDVVQPAAKEIGVALQTVAKTSRIAVVPLEALVWGYEKIRAGVIAYLSKRLKDVPKEEIVIPSMAVAGPTLEALRFAGPEPTLRELYLNLLATSMDARTAKDAHPGFVEIIRQMTPDEARIVSLFSHPFACPLISIVSTEIENEFRFSYAKRNFCLLPYEAGCSHPDLIASYIDNLCRLGLTIIPDRLQWPDAKAYEPLEKHLSVLECISEIEDTRHVAKIHRLTLHVTDLGIQFVKACVTQEEAAVETATDEASAIDRETRDEVVKDYVERGLKNSFLVGLSITISGLNPFIGFPLNEIHEALWQLSREGVIQFDEEIAKSEDVDSRTKFRYLG